MLKLANAVTALVLSVITTAHAATITLGFNAINSTNPETIGTVV